MNPRDNVNKESLDNTRQPLFTNLPDDLSNLILQHFGIFELVQNARLVNKDWQSLCDRLISERIIQKRSDLVKAIQSKNDVVIEQLMDDAINNGYLPYLWEHPSQSEINTHLKNHIIPLIEAGKPLILKQLFRADLSGAHLHFPNLANVNLSYANLSGISMHHPNLSNINLSYSNLSGANLNWPKLENANLSHANLTRAVIHLPDLDNANLSYANLTEISMSRITVKNVNLSHTNLTKARLSEIKFDNANIQNSILLNAELNNCDFIMSDLSNANLQGAEFSLSTFWLTNLAGADLRGTNLFPTNYQPSTTFRYLPADRLIGARLQNIQIDKQTLINNKFTEDDIKELKLKIVSDSISFIKNTNDIDQIVDFLEKILTTEQHPLKYIRDSIMSEYGNTKSSAEVINAGKEKLLALLDDKNQVDFLTKETIEKLKMIATADIYSTQEGFSVGFSSIFSEDIRARIAKQFISRVMQLQKKDLSPLRKP